MSLFVTNMFNKKKKYFQTMLAEMQKVIWDLEFKKFKTMQVRENNRRQYDRASDALQRVTVESNAKPENKELLAQKENIERSVTNIKAEIDTMDQMISGAEPSEINPEGVEGITQKLDSFVELKGYLQRFIKNNC